MNVEWSDSDREIVDRARAFAEASLSGRRGVDGFDQQAWAACAKERMLALPLASASGGEGRSLRVTAGVFEALGRGGADRGLLFAMGAHLFGCALAVERHATSAQRGRYLNGLADGSCIGALAVTEGGGGTSPAHWTTRLERDAAGYRLSGGKLYVTNAPTASLFLVLAVDDAAAGAFGLTAVLVPRETPGLQVEPLASLGLRGAPMGRVLFSDCRIPPDAVVGAPRTGLGVLHTCMRYERTCILAGLLGAAARDLAACVARMKARQGAERALLGHQAVGHRLARMHCRLEAARSLLDRGADALDRGVSATHDPAVVKLVVSEALVACAVDTLQVFAGAGWVDPDGVGSALSDTVGTLSASGTSDAQLNSIASALPHLYP